MTSLHKLFSVLMIITATCPLHATASVDKQWNFRVYLDDKEIGYHHFIMDREDDMQTISIEARFKVKYFGIPFYTYTHDNAETWDGRCLQGITAVTDDNGKQFRVEGTAIADGVTLQTIDGARLLSGCISTFSYWDKSFLDSKKLLNSQTGDYLDVTSSFLGKEILDTGNNRIPALRYRLTSTNINIDIWYSESDEWVGLQSTTKGGRILRYVIE